MKLKDYMSISGEHGLYKFVAQGRNAIIIEHLETGKRSTAYGSAKVSSLEDISIFTETEDLPLAKVFDRIFEKENGGAAPDYKSDPEILKTYFQGIVPDYDRERVYHSDIKKIIMWYNVLQKLNLLVKDEPEPEQDAKTDDESRKEEKTAEKIKQEKVSKPRPKASEKKVPPAGKTESKSAAIKPKGAPKAK
jgi:hypothetical protein